MGLVRLGVAVLALAAGCVSPDLVPCGEDDCPTGTRCITPGQGERSHRCVDPGQLAACEGHAEFDACMTDRRCYAHDQGLVCLDAGCGNALLDPEEQCDDENQIGGDGCSADCLSDERCGNGVLDVIRGELCDDRNARSHDGCSSACQPESAHWEAEFGEREPPGYVLGAFTYDTRRGRVISFGGGRVGFQGLARPSNDLVESTAPGAWIANHRIVAPSPRVDATIAYDRDRGVVVVFGGNTTGVMADTWEWRGAAWSLAEASGPEGRRKAAMAYDPIRRRTILLGGIADAVAVPTWEWDGTTWTPQPTAGPVGDTQHVAMAFDDRRGVMVAAIVTPPAKTVLWERGTGSWRSVGEVDAEISALAFDPARGRMLLTTPDQAWHWDGGSLVEVAPSPIMIGALVTAGDRGHVIGLSRGRLAGLDTVVWNGTTWEPPSTSALDEPVVGAGVRAITDTRRRQGVMFGGDASSNATWLFEHGRWVDANVAGPPARYDHVLAYRERSGETVLFGGVSSSTLLADTWVWNGSSWRLESGPGPFARRGAAAAYDAARDRVVVFGGSTSVEPWADRVDTCSCPDLSTWEWDGVAWTEVATTGPIARRDAVMAYDPVHREIVLFGGHADASALGDTWIYNGTWTRPTLPAAPTPRFAATLTWDAARQRLVLAGGFEVTNVFHPNALRPLHDIWEWDGMRWRPVAVDTAAHDRGDHATLSDPAGAGVILVGGRDGSGPIFESSGRLRWMARGPDETCETRVDADGDSLAGCADPDCWSACTPSCIPGTSCTGGTSCGNGVCDPLETPAICAVDCGPPPVTCGDLVCDGTETCASDCP